MRVGLQKDYLKNYFQQMKRLLVLLLFILTTKSLYAQYTVRLVVNEVAAKKEDPIYVSGSFNNWNVRDEKYKLKPLGVTRRAIVLKDMAAGTYSFKFTRGTPDKVETTAKGQEIAPHEIVVKEDISLDFNIPGWKDDYPDKPKPNTATAQVKLLDSAFAAPRYNRKTKIWAYLPKGYATATKRYPVIYMHDGQNLFNEQTARRGEWEIDETLDTLMRKTGKEAIIIGIESDTNRRSINFNPYVGDGNDASLYADFVALSVKPFIDKNLRTLKDSAHTFIGGSNMGALISVYTSIKYSSVFGGAGFFSPSFRNVTPVYDAVAKANWGKSVKRFYFYVGGKENESSADEINKMITIIESKGNYETRRLVNPLGSHNEEAWRKAFADFYQFVIR